MQAGLGIIVMIGTWGHVVAAILFAVAGIIMFRRRGFDGAETRPLIAAMLMTACWSLFVALEGGNVPTTALAEAVRNGGWLVAMFILMRRGPVGRTRGAGGITAVYAAVIGLIGAQVVLETAAETVLAQNFQAHGLLLSILTLQMMTAIGALILVHHLYMAWPFRERNGVTLLLGALAAMFTYDFSLHAMRFGSVDRVSDVYALRGIFVAALAPMCVMGFVTSPQNRPRLSRTVAMQSASVAGLIIYVVIALVGAMLLATAAGPQGRVVAISSLFAAAVALLLLLPSNRFRASMRVMIAKHFFQHRYDYRTEWLRFGETIGQRCDAQQPLGQRIAQAIAQITDSPAAILMLCDDSLGLVPDAYWRWEEQAGCQEPIAPAMAREMEATGWIVDLADHGRVDRSGLPGWVREQGWALAPLIHYNRLVGAVLLAPPPVLRPLDWEDLDMLRAAGRQAATYLSEALGQEALGDAQRFEEFNRRFAFILHDVKNLVSQLSLLARNAERHADNPQFRADMILSLRDSVARMNDLLARLSQHNKAQPDESCPVALRAMVDGIAATKVRQHRVCVAGDAPTVLADPVRFEQIVAHLIQNAIDASASDVPVQVSLGSDGRYAMIEIKDQGCGMTREFVRRELFKPFASSKPGGFGLGAFEARTCVEAMGGTIEVDSAPGAGSRFILRIPAIAEQWQGEAA